MRNDGRAYGQIRPLSITPSFTSHAEGSVLIALGNTKVICNASIDESVPHFLRGKHQGWITAEYQMLPRATHKRSQREVNAGKLSGRSMEISRLIGRSLRSVVDLCALGERSIILDCDVIEADGSTRCVAITGAYIALSTAIERLMNERKITYNPLTSKLAAVSVGIVNDEILCDLNYAEDCIADTDMNLIMNDKGFFVEIQGTAEHKAFSYQQLHQLLATGKAGIEQIFAITSYYTAL